MATIAALVPFPSRRDSALLLRCDGSANHPREAQLTLTAEETMAPRHRALAFGVLISLTVVLGACAGARSGQAVDPRIGTWKLNVAKSQFNPGPPQQSLTVRVQPSGQGETVSTEGVNADGSRAATQYTANFDGKDYPLTGSQVADTVSLKRVDPQITERTDKKAGAVAQTLRRVVSQDGKTMTVTVKGKNAQGQDVNNTLVFEKQ